MTISRVCLGRTLAPAMLLFGLAAVPAHAVTLFQQTDLVSDGSVPAVTTDPDLINPWGVSFGPTSPFWVSDNGTGVATLYNGAGGKININPPAGNVIIPPASGSGTSAPTGQVFNLNNGPSGSFGLSNGSPARFIFASEDGAISGWNGGTTALIAVNNSASGAVYKGLAIDNAGGTLFATNFNSGLVEMYDKNFGLVKTFTDGTLPAGYAPFNARVLNGQLYVTFALQNDAKHDDVAGAGHGFVDVFDLSGNFVKRLISNGILNSPWGLEIAPASFGDFAGKLLVGNFGDGLINAFDASTGAFDGTLRGTDYAPLVEGDLWALTVGNDAAAGSSSSLYFTAGLWRSRTGCSAVSTRWCLSPRARCYWSLDSVVSCSRAVVPPDLTGRLARLPSGHCKLVGKTAESPVAVKGDSVEPYSEWARATFSVNIPTPGVLFAASFAADTTWGQKCHEALLGVEIEYVEHLLRDIDLRRVPGALAEFGVFQGWWVNHLFEVSQRLGLDRPVLGFDSFQGLSEPDPERDDPFWKAGQYAASLAAVAENVKAQERPRIKLIPGFFADSLVQSEALLVRPIAYARIDCDIYEPAAQCLSYLAPRLSHGAVLVFDDGPHRLEVGEARAFAEWLPTVPHLRFEVPVLRHLGSFLYTRLAQGSRSSLKPAPP